jgi:2-amino-4-hydroxy-6-hydroxymethyldihydropteridine diphosphokinase
MSHRVFLSLGSNIAAAENLPAGLALLRSHGLRAISGIYATAAVGTRAAPPFLNAAVLLVTDVLPAEFKLGVCRRIEDQLGRIRQADDKDAPRTIDLDIALWDDTVLDVLGSPVPDPDIVRHLHVARPLADLAPEMVVPGDGRTLATIATTLASACPPRGWPRLRTDVAGWDLRF